MAFPTTVSATASVATGCGGPFLSSGGNVYVIARDTVTNTKLRAFKATDPTSSFSNVGTDFAVTSGRVIEALAAYQVGDNIHVATHDSTNGSACQIRYHVFSMSSDTWTTTNEAVKGTDFALAADVFTLDIGIAVRSDGDVIVLYNGPSSGGFDRVYYARKESGTWTVDIAVDNGGSLNWRANGIVVGSSDRMHFFFFENTFFREAYQRALTSANALETFPSAFDSDIRADTNAMQARGASYVSGANTKVRFPYFDAASDAISSAKCDSADAPTMSTDVDITGSSAAQQVRHGTSFAANGTTLWHTYTDSVFDIYTQSNADDAGWSAPALFYTGTVNYIYTNVYTRGTDIVLGIVFNESEPKYTEKVLGSTGNAASLTAAATLTMSSASTATSNLNAAATATLTGRGASTASGALNANAVATLTMSGGSIRAATLAIPAIPYGGYFGGGFSSSASAEIDGIKFSDESAINPSAALSVARTELAGVSSSVKGYFGGGFTSAESSEIDGIQFSDESAINPAATLSVARYGVAGVNSSLKGYFGGGFSGVDSNEIDGIQFSDDTAINPSATLNVARQQLTGVSSPLRGYFGGGFEAAASAEIDGIRFSDETAINPAATLSVARQQMGGVNSSLKGYFGGGFIGPVTTEIDGIQFSDETAINPAAALSVARGLPAGISSPSKGYFGGGSGAGASEIDGIQFSDESAINPAATLSVGRNGLAGVQPVQTGNVAVLSLVGASITGGTTDGAFTISAAAAFIASGAAVAADPFFIAAAATLTAQSATIAAGAAQSNAAATVRWVGSGGAAVARRDYGLPKRRHLQRLAEDDAEVMRIIEAALPYLG